MKAARLPRRWRRGRKRGRAEGNDEADDEAERHEKSRVTPRHSSSEAFSRLIANASDTLVPPDKLKNTHR